MRPFLQFLYSVFILLTFLVLSYSLCLYLGCSPDFFYTKAGVSLGGRALSLALCKGLGCSGGLAWAIVISTRFLLTTAAPASLSFLLFLDEAGSSEAPGSSPWTPLLGSSSVSGSSVNQGEAAGQPDDIPPFTPYPYQPDQVIGGDSVNSIQSRLLANEPLPSPERCQLARFDAEDLFEVKVAIVEFMSVHDPTGNWLERGAEALANPRTASGEPKLETLYGILDNLRTRGAQSEDFWALRDKMIWRRELHDESSAAEA